MDNVGIIELHKKREQYIRMGWSGGAKVLGQLPVPGHPTYLDYSRARAYCACSRCGLGSFGYFFSHVALLFSFSLSLGDGPILTKILSQRAVKVVIGDGRVVRRCWVNFQCRGVLEFGLQ